MEASQEDDNRGFTKYTRREADDVASVVSSRAGDRGSIVFHPTRAIHDSAPAYADATDDDIEKPTQRTNYHRKKTDETAFTNSKNNLNKSQHHVQFSNSNKSIPNLSNGGRAFGSSTSASQSSTSSSSSSDDEEYSESKPPDGGWGWVVVLAAFVVNFIADGISFSFGVIYPEFVAYFNEANSKTALIGSFFLAIPLLSGPIASNLTDRYGCRKMCMAGGVLASLGFILSSFANSIEMLLLTFGVLSGFGLSLSYVAAVVIVAYYFEKRRSFATGLSVCGSGIGTLVFAPLMEYLMREYGWRGATQVLAGLLLNLCVCGALMRDLPWTKIKRKKRKRSKTLGRLRINTSTSTDSISHCSPSGDGSGPPPSMEEIRKLLQPPDYAYASCHDSQNEPNLEAEERKYSSLVSLPTYIKNEEPFPLEVLEGLTSNRHLYSVLLHNYPSLLISARSISDSGCLNDQNQRQKTQRSKYVAAAGTSPHLTAKFLSNKKLFIVSNAEGENHPHHHHQSTSHPSPATATNNEDTHKASTSTVFPSATASRNSSFIKSKRGGLAAVCNSAENNAWWNKSRSTDAPALPTSFLKDLRVHRHSLTYRGAMLNIRRYRLRASSCPDIYRNSLSTIADERKVWYSGVLESIWSAVADMMDFSYFKNVGFLLFAISNFLLYAWYDVPYVYLADYSTRLGISKQDSSYLIGVSGLFNMVGEIALGWAGDQDWMKVHITYAISMVLCGASIAVIPLLRNYVYLSTASASFGLFIAANYSLTSIILVSLVNLDNFTEAYGLLLLVQGVANLIGPPLAGWIFDATGYYDYAFYLSGFFITLSGVLLCVIPCLKMYAKMKNAKCAPHHRNTLPV